MRSVQKKKKPKKNAETSQLQVRAQEYLSNNCVEFATIR